MIEKEPDVPPEIIRKINENKLCFFLGAGASKLIGCKGWTEVATSLAKKCFKLKYINFKKLESILRINDSKKIITICYNILSKEGSTDGFYNEVRESLKTDSYLLNKYNIYAELSDIPAIFITTNIDTHFDSAFNERIVYKEEDFTPTNIFRDKLYKIHGTIKDETSIIFTVPQYLDRYRKDDFLAFLTTIFNTYSIVFLGYGLEEFEILDFLVTKIGKENPERKHWILLPYYTDEEYMKDYDKDYFLSLGITVIGYEKDIDGYSQSYNVIKKWNKEINQLSDIPHEDVNEMEILVDTL